ncbi:MAG: PIN domain-containing protein [Candidatus Hadarchaeota archaeon]
MKVLIDAGPFIALLNKDDPNHQNAVEQFDRIYWTKGICFTSDYVLTEVLAYATRKTKSPEVVLEMDRLIQGSGNIHMLKVDGAALGDAKAFLKKYPKLLLSLTDWTSIALAVEHGIGKIYSYDSDFDQLMSTPEFRHIRRVEEI